MNLENLIPLPELCSLYKMEMSFFTNLSEMGLVEIKTVETISYIDSDCIYEIEKMIHIYQDLDVNIEGIDVVFNLLLKMDTLQSEIISLKNRLRLYES
ncbi:MerR HTH family regulatory protein [Flavobacterium micromati]|uniref:MerR HTH family regulatory protein n=1 Tax=Flavobacterium micromati TaxID=229205 RepID=A0A1M5IKW9_9FLAO|nr:chaperone modulator CbpM [Flavobacterium micromati]MCL6460381.1 chaperone modulator CbpM [Flavobacterium micromati]SHG28699.1 MerR HTH family regulatory protein [Flavobacterium micromati]